MSFINRALAHYKVDSFRKLPLDKLQEAHKWFSEYILDDKIPF